MDTKSDIAVALERTGAVRALLALEAHGAPMRSSELAAAIGGYAGRGTILAQHLAKHGLVDVKKGTGVAGKPSYQIRLTARGQRIVRALLG